MASRAIGFAAPAIGLRADPSGRHPGFGLLTRGMPPRKHAAHDLAAGFAPHTGLIVAEVGVSVAPVACRAGWPPVQPNRPTASSTPGRIRVMSAESPRILSGYCAGRIAQSVVRETRVGCLCDNAGGVAARRAASSESRPPPADCRPTSCAAVGNPHRGRGGVRSLGAVDIPGCRGAGRKAPINDSWIAATAIAHGVPIVTQDSDYDAIPDLKVIRI